MKKIECVKKKIEKIIKNSLVPEDPIHSKNTLEWLLKLKPDADGISFFHVNLPEYFSRNGKKETEKRWVWGYRRLSEKEKIIIAKFNYQDKELNALVTTWLEKSQLCL